MFGDSVAFGANGDNGGWVDILRRAAFRQIEATKGAEKAHIFNLGVGWGDSRNVLARAENEILARVIDGWETEVAVAVGTNDARFLAGEEFMTESEFRENLAKIFKTIKKFTEKIYFVEPSRLGKSRFDFLVENTFDEKRLREFAKIAREVCEETGVEFIELAPEFSRDDGSPDLELVSFDNLHPNSRGHEVIAKVVGARLNITPENLTEG